MMAPLAGGQARRTQDYLEQGRRILSGRRRCHGLQGNLNPPAAAPPHSASGGGHFRQISS